MPPPPRDAAAARRGPPELADGAFVHPTATVCGTVRLGREASVWTGAVLRGDTEWITIGDGSNIQDLTMVHADPGFPTTVGAGVTVGHRAILHGCTIEDDVLVGMGAILLNGCHIGRGSIIGAGALVAQGVAIPPGSMVLGMPGKVVRATTVTERDRLAASAATYRRLAVEHAEGRIRYHAPPADR
ncbi:MAG: gamma carbonic anhydrase family protein [Gemmatimonadaceae bacterium]|nr:gamma carbonic anhydrase family protein [Gemmatimonadaceae bacterium]